MARNRQLFNTGELHAGIVCFLLKLISLYIFSLLKYLSLIVESIFINKIYNAKWNLKKEDDYLEEVLHFCIMTECINY